MAPFVGHVGASRARVAAKGRRGASTDEEDEAAAGTASAGVGRLALLVDSKIAACPVFNLAAELKQHAVTLYEVGKIPHESLDDFLVAAAEIGVLRPTRPSPRYFDHAIALRDAARFLRSHPAAAVGGVQRLDIVRTESLLSLEPQKRRQVLGASRSARVDGADGVAGRARLRPRRLCARRRRPRAPRPRRAATHLAVVLALRLRDLGAGPRLLLRRGRLRALPPYLASHASRLVPWGEPAVIRGGAALAAANEMLLDAPLLLQHGRRAHRTRPFPRRRRIGGGAGRGGGGSVGQAGV